MREQHDWKGMMLAALFPILGACVNEVEQRVENTAEEMEMADNHHIHHEIDYIEFDVIDMDAAKRFYEAAFDWEFNDYGPGYAGIRRQRGGEAGGFRLMPEVTTGGPLVILYSGDLEATLSRVVEAGGQITQEPFEFPGGRRFHFRDPSGYELAVWADE